MLVTFRLVKNILKLIMCSIALSLIFHFQSNSTRPHGRLKDGNRHNTPVKQPRNLELIYVLIWNRDYEFKNLKRGRETFVSKNCKFTNCFVSRHRNMLNNNYLNYHAILFSGKSLKNRFVDGYFKLPKNRDSDQIYVFGMQEDAVRNPICDERFDNYFNLTWTYKLDSDVIWPHFHIIDRATVEFVAPKTNVKWRLINKDSDTIYEIQEKLLEKSDYGVWISNKCVSQSGREKIVARIKEESDINDYTLDVKGACCANCNKVETGTAQVLKPYSFYLAFESVLADDYVTGGVAEAIKQYCLPVVYGGANYSRFFPPHSYIDATKLGPVETARTMAHLMSDIVGYFGYFDWRTSYAIRKDKGESACNLCEALNQKRRGAHVNFRKWWNPNYETVCAKLVPKISKKYYNLNYQHQVVFHKIDPPDYNIVYFLTAYTNVYRPM